MPTAPSLPAGSTLGHSYEYGLDVNLGTPESPQWQTFRRISDFQPNVTPVTQDAATYDDFGSPNADKTGESWALTYSALVNRSATTGLYTPEIEAVLAKTKPSAKGNAAILHVRYYHKPESGAPNPDDAFEGYATVGVQRANTGADGAVEKFTITLTGKGPREEIENPFTGWGTTVPKATSAFPSAAAAAELVTINGTGFLGATQVKFGATNAADYTVIGDGTIVASVPAGSAGSAAITVVTPAGTSDALPYTRGA